MATERVDIIVRGPLSPEKTVALNGFDPTFCSDGFTHLVGDIVDDEQLRSVRELLSHQGVEVVSVRPVGADLHQHRSGGPTS